MSWRPNGGHIGTAAKAGDAELRALADIFKLPDINSAEAGRGAKKVSLPPPAPAGAEMHTFAPGFVAPVARGQGASCTPSAAKVDFKVGAKLGERLSPNPTFGGATGMRSNTVIEAATKG